MLRISFLQSLNKLGGPVEERITEEEVLHHKSLAAQAEQDRKILQEELLRQQQDFREVHQQDLMKMKELQKFQNSTFDEFTNQKFIEDQKLIMELSGRLQELQNEENSHE